MEHVNAKVGPAYGKIIANKKKAELKKQLLLKEKQKRDMSSDSLL